MKFRQSQEIMCLNFLNNFQTNCQEMKIKHKFNTIQVNFHQIN
jgi:hypothetical protein